jgi:hypothetical protein
VELPAQLRCGAVTVEDFVPSGEQPPHWWGRGGADDSDAEWRKIRALRRWQDAVTAWGAERGLDVRQLRALGFYPGRPPRFRDTHPG